MNKQQFNQMKEFEKTHKHCGNKEFFDISDELHGWSKKDWELFARCKNFSLLAQWGAEWNRHQETPKIA